MGPDERVSRFGATVTLLFADIECSTSLLERLGRARWLEILGAYEGVVRARVADYGGCTPN